jgi:polygalacturonase
MAQGDVVIFDEAKAYMIDGGWEPADVIKCAILDDTVTPAAGDTTPALGDYNEVGVAGTYVAGGTSLGSLGTLVTEAGGTMTFDSTTNPSWAKDASNDADAFWGLIYNDTDAGDLAIGFVDLGGPVDMTAGDLTITWNASGIFTIADA